MTMQLGDLINRVLIQLDKLKKLLAELRIPEKLSLPQLKLESW
jgi:hypothetical protein